MQSRFFEIFRLTTYSLGLIFVCNLLFSLFYHQFVYSVVLNDRIPEELLEPILEDQADQKIGFMETVGKLTESIKTIEEDFKTEFKDNPQKSFESFYDIMLKKKQYLLFFQSVIWFVSFVGLGYLVLVKILKIEITNLQEDLSFKMILTGVSNGFIVFLSVMIIGIIFQALGVDANPGVFPQKLFKELNGNSYLLAWAVYTVGIITGIVEELFFRGFLLKSFMDKGLAQEGLMIISIIFGWLHYGPGTTVAVPFLIAFVGMYFGYLYLKTKNLWVSMACHATYNTLGLLIAYFGVDGMTP
ncbi:CPBP family intramembrane glutamic endopeptidase [Leptospira kobayashii]|uniref:CPBP family intramembrane glutamic endopeptidase n=1 Tax=Leptospira kobayashii TaxID=1917830 RepID=UPI000D2B23B8|nr:CPBP family intramembrane glutamic endopeptidase [Leptospira kobayashii]